LTENEQYLKNLLLKIDTLFEGFEEVAIEDIDVKVVVDAFRNELGLFKYINYELSSKKNLDYINDVIRKTSKGD
jgi:hypothetical protein